ncbi:MAG: hypothetical protein EDX89_15030 [Acidobacteria bacterium]|nr:MAG: hypothetical protein EDX89_15030 [Acidobacteriota bacterium]
MTPTPRGRSRSERPEKRWAALLVPLAALALAVPAAAGPCPPERPTLTVPPTVRAGQSYSVSWNDVFVAPTTAADYYALERSGDPGFGSVERVKTTRSALTLPALGPTPALVYHRVVVHTGCAGSGPGTVSSDVKVVRVSTECVAPAGVGPLSVSSEYPPAYSTYVVSWDAGGCAGPGPGGCDVQLSYRLRRVTPWSSQEMVTDKGSASFSDAPGEYVYQVRAEDPCGAAGPWSLPVRVTVGDVTSALSLVAEPKSLLAIAPGTFPTTTLVVRNAGTAPVAVYPTTGAGPIRVDSAPFVLAPNEARSVEVLLATLAPMDAPAHQTVELRTGVGGIAVPVDGMVAAAPAGAPVTWRGDPVEPDSDGRAQTRTLVNASDTAAAVVSTVRPSWVTVESLDGKAWDRPLAPREERPVRVVVDRARRRQSTGTETGFVSVETAGWAGQPQVLAVIDDGPDLPLSDPVRPSAASARSRILYASMPNARDVTGEGQFTSDLWLANLDATAPVDVSLFFTPIARSGAEGGPRRADIRLSPGETRRFRNVVGKIPGFEGACALEVSSPATTLAATAVVGNTPLTPVAAAKRGLTSTPGAGFSGGVPQYGFEMRPTAPGEGVKAGDPPYVLSGLRHDARRRTNVLLTETSGYPTVVRLKLFDELGNAVERGGQQVVLDEEVPALSTVQVNDDALFGDPLSGSPYATVEFVRGILDPFNGRELGSVVPFATVIDGGTQDASLRVGISTGSLDPVPPASVAAPAAKDRLLTSLPFGGGPAPLLFPAVHVTGAPLSGGARPIWRSRVTFTNVNETEQRRVRVRFLDQTGRKWTSNPVFIGPGQSATFEDVLEELFPDEIGPSSGLFGPVTIENQRNPDGTTWLETWQDVDVQTETYTPDPVQPGTGDFKTGMEGYSYRHGYTSFQSNLGTAQIDGAESSSAYRTNLILQEVGGASCQLAISAYLPGSFTPIATVSRTLPPFAYVSEELFRGLLGVDLSGVTDVRVVVRQLDGDGVFVAFASKINLATGDPANIFLRPASAGTGR